MSKIPPYGLALFTFNFKGPIIQKRTITKEEPCLHSFRTENSLTAGTFKCIHTAGSDLSRVVHFCTCSCGTFSASTQAHFEGVWWGFFAQLNSQTFFQAASATQVVLMKASFRQLQFLKGTNYASSPASLPAMNAFRNQWSFHMADGSLGLSST